MGKLATMYLPAPEAPGINATSFSNISGESSLAIMKAMRLVIDECDGLYADGNSGLRFLDFVAHKDDDPVIAGCSSLISRPCNFICFDDFLYKVYKVDLRAMLNEQQIRELKKVSHEEVYSFFSSFKQLIKKNKSK